MLLGFPNLKGIFSFSVCKIHMTISYEKAEKWSNKLEGEEKKSTLTICQITTILSQISAIYMNIFHKTEVPDGHFEVLNSSIY